MENEKNDVSAQPTREVRSESGTPRDETAEGCVRRVTKTYAICPACGKDAGAVDHLLGQTTKTWWYCDACGARYELDFREGTVFVSRASGRKITTIDVLRLPPQKNPVYFVVEGMRFEDEMTGRHVTAESADMIREHKQYYYEEHSCPTNWLKPEMVYTTDGDADPHGLLEFVATRDASAFPPDEDWGPNPHDQALIDFIEESRSASSS